MSRITFTNDDFEILDKLKSLPKSILTENKEILNFLDENSFRKDMICVFSDHTNTYLVLKIGKVDDSGFIMMHVEHKDVFLLLIYLKKKPLLVSEFRNSEIILNQLKALSCKYPNPFSQG